ncbi:hypothetical protein FLONG3_2127 [Fusarium longipes]|uniref:Uncharacterized protein n=1 Tax=Fusarium longipes TaxID=694270 RepID=A0A395T4Z3_9HYPO|nr:hypothetical protein FLONG3_2127 [Fusarium longipes]
MEFIPHIWITSPNGEQVPVIRFPVPVPSDDKVEPWEFFADQLVDPEPAPAPKPEPEPETEPFERYNTRIAFATAKRNIRVPANEFRPTTCRICGISTKSFGRLRRHLGLSQDKMLRCWKARDLLAPPKEDRQVARQD